MTMPAMVQAVAEGTTAEAVVWGQDVELFDKKPADCQHRMGGLDCVTAIVNDERGNIDHREIRVRTRCMECGVPLAIDFDKIRRPKEGELHGIVLTVTPMEDA